MSLHGRIANEMPALSHLECMTCGRKEPLIPGEVSLFLAHGWPKCCGYTMRLFTQREVEDA